MNIKDIKNVKKIWAFENEFAVYETIEGKSGIINRQGEVICPATEADSACQLEDGWFMFDQYQADGTPARTYYNARTGEKSDHYAVRKTETPNPLSDVTKYKQLANDDNLYWCGYNRLAFHRNGLIGIMDTKGNIIAKPQFTFVKNFYRASSQRILVKKDDMMGAIDLDGNIIILCRYRYVGYNQMTGTHTVHALSGKWGLLDENGNEILPAIYDSVSVHETYGLNEIAVSKDGRCYFINNKQEEVKVFQ